MISIKQINSSTPQLQSEADFQRTLIEYLQWHGWKVHAERVARTKSGWVTPIQGDPGFPDIVAAKGACLIIAELKSDKGILTQEQYDWLEALGRAGAEVFYWKPEDWDEIVEILEKHE